MLATKFHYAVQLRTSSELAPNQLRTGSEPAPNQLVYGIWHEPASNQLRTSSELASVMEFGFNSELARASRSATSFEPVCDQLQTRWRNGIWFRTGLRPASSRFELSRHVEIGRTCSELVANGWKPNSIALSGSKLVADLSQTC